MTKPPKQLVKDYKAYIDSFPSYSKAATTLGFSKTYLHSVYTGKEPITEKLAELVGWKLRSVWERTR